MKTKPMTKFALAVAIACAALVGQAGKLYWSASDIKGTSANSLTGTGQYLAYLFATRIEPSGTSMAENSATTTIDEIKSLLTSSGDKTSELDAKSKMYYDTGRDAASAKTTNTGYSDGTASYDKVLFGRIGLLSGYDSSLVSVFAVVFDASTYTDAKNYMLLTGSDGGSLTKTITTGWSDESETGATFFDFGSQANNSWVSLGTVPEPTSGVLLALGVAALALKRKKEA